MQSYKVCAVPLCGNNTSNFPNKLYIHVPENCSKRRQEWLKLARRDEKLTSDKSKIYFCEDHFDLPNDMENYIQYSVMGSVGKIRMKPDCLPSRFQCQPDRIERTASPQPRSAVCKIQRKEITKELICEETEISATSGMTINSGTMVAVKQEKPPEADEAEINAMAAKIQESIRAKTATTNANNPSQMNRALTNGPGGQTSLIGYVVSRPNQSKPAQVTIPVDKTAIDEDSQRGRFGWVTLGNAHIPYIVRFSEHYCAVRMVEVKLLNKFLSYLNADIYNYTNIRSYYITDAEARVLNEINLKHCDAHFGRETFTANKDVVVRLQDAKEFHGFLEVCFNKLSYNSSNPNDRCGFIRINNESVVPYTLRENTKYVPLFYFEGETESLKTKADNLEGWDLAYLKFCCKVQGIRNELFASETCSVISLEDIRNYFPVGTRFDDYWPPKVVDNQLIAKSPVANASWTRTPAGVAPVAAVVMKPVAPAQRSFPAAHTPPVAGTPGPAASLPPSVMNSWANGPIMHQQHAANMVSQQNSMAARMASMNALPNGNAAYGPALRPWPTTVASPYYPYSQVSAQMTMAMQSQQKTHPPPLVRNSQHAAAAAVDGARTYAAASAMHKMQSRAQTNSVAAGERYGLGPDVMDLSSQQYAAAVYSNGRTVAQKRKLIQIDETPVSGGNMPPYQMQKVLVEGKTVPCINMSPYNYEEVMMTIPDLYQCFFPLSNAATVMKVLQEVLKVNLYCGNRQQMEVLRASNRSSRDHAALIQVKDAIQYMPHLKYVITNGNKQPACEPLQAKRHKLS